MAPRATVGPCREMELEDDVAQAASPSHEMELEEQVARAVEGGTLLDSRTFGVESSDDGSEVRQPHWWRRHRRTAAVAAGLCGALVLGCMASVHRGGSQPTNSGDVQEAVGLHASFLEPILEGMDKAIEGVGNLQATYEQAQEAMGKAKKFMHEANASQGDFNEFWKQEAEARRAWRDLNASQQAAIRAALHKKFNITGPNDLHPLVNLTDGVPCEDDEEYHLGLCYKKCSLITKGEYPKRSSAFECCKPESCTDDFKFRFGICSKHNVAGDFIGGGCPHLPGGCLKNEEILHGMCFKKCSLLTFGKLPYRWGASTCCKQTKATTGVRVLDSVFKEGCDTEESFNAGGGKDDSSASMPHTPQVELTEGVAKKSA